MEMDGEMGLQELSEWLMRCQEKAKNQ